MKKILIFITSVLVILLGISIYFFIDINNSHKHLTNNYKEVIDKETEMKNNEQIYLEKVSKLEELKEEKKNEINKYNEVDAWNQELKQYLD